MHTMQEQPGRCLGCLVVVAIDVLPTRSVTLSWVAVALFIRLSRVADSCSCAGLWLAAILRFLNSTWKNTTNK